MIHFAHLTKVGTMGLGDLLRELRLMKGQDGYRYCLAWLVVAIHICARPSLIAFGLWI